MRSVGAGPACRFQQAFLPSRDQDAVQHPQPGVSLHQPIPELRQYREVGPRIAELEAERVLEVDPGPDRFRGLPVGEPFDGLQHRYQREPTR
ncbi:hypothetical protein APS67_006780 [Streptomyces sp. AVP053U2]|nr:hypothetical protein APS67_006780 [Streptomyces sp. AVP053U2]